MLLRAFAAAFIALPSVFSVRSALAQTDNQKGPVILHAARLLDVEAGRTVSPGEVLVENGRIVEAGNTVAHPAGARTVDLGKRTLMPGLIDVHVHLFLHPGAEDLQTVEESVPQRTIVATLAARAAAGPRGSERDQSGRPPGEPRARPASPGYSGPACHKR